MTAWQTRGKPAILNLSLGASLLLLGGCATLNGTQAPPVSVQEVVQLSQQHVAPEAIIQKMRAAGTIYPLSASQLADLRTQGVDNRVIDYMQGTYLAQAEWQGRMADPWYGPWGPPMGFGAWGHWYGQRF